MSENYENYSETDWANDFLVKIQNRFLDNQSRAEFRGMLDEHNIQKNEAQGFLDAYMKGSKALENFLQERKKTEEKADHIIELPKDEKEKPAKPKKAA